MGSLDQDMEVHDALKRLVGSIVDEKDESESLLLARQILSSSVGTKTIHRRLSSTWNRIERTTSKTTRKQVQELYEKLQQAMDPKLAEQVVEVLSKVAAANERRDDTSGQQPRGEHKTALLLQADQETKLSGDRFILAKEVEKEETLLLRECLYALQGMDGERIRYHWSINDTEDVKEEGIRIRPSPLLESVALDPNIPSRIGSGGEDALRICGEAGFLHSRLASYIRENTGNGSHGMVSQALSSALSNKLQDYYALLSSIEADITTSGLTLRQLLVELREPTLQLKTLAMVTDGIGHFSGGQLLNALYQHSLHGDTRHALLVQNLVSSASQPWYQLLYLWTTQGELIDPHGEFFIQQDSTVNDELLWSDRYTIDEEQIIPNGILDQDLVRPAWILGKGINFIRKCLLDTEWRIDLGEKMTLISNIDEKRKLLGYQYVADTEKSQESRRMLRKTLFSVGEQVHSHILSSLRNDHHLMDHLWGLKQFLFLGQGDFFTAFMEGMNAELGERTGLAGIYRHSIMSIVDDAIRDTNARQLPSYVLERLKVEINISKDDDAHFQFAAPRDAKHQDNRSPWDFIQFDYTVPDTLSAIVDELAMKQYKQVFSLLFQLKRVEFVLNSTWRQSTSLHHAMQTFAQHNAIQVSTSSAYARSLVLLRKISMARQSMMHFVGNLKSYFMFEVLEGGWKDLSLRIKVAKTLDEVIDAHRHYLTGVVRKSLLTSVTESRATESEKILAARLHELLMIAKAFCEHQERLFSDALGAVERATEKRRAAEQRLKEGKWGFSTEEEFEEEESFFGLTDATVAEEADRILQDFNEKTKLLLEGLYGVVNGVSAAPSIESMSPAVTPSSHSKAAKVRSTWTSIEPETVAEPFDHDSLRFLTFQLDFSGYYNQ